MAADRVSAGALSAALTLLGWSMLSAQDASPPQTFRTGVDLVRIDVTVLDPQRRPVRGLTSQDFTVTEEGRPQRIVAVAEFDAEDADPLPTAWMRYTPSDVASNNLADALGEGQAVAIVLDDAHTPDDSTEMIVSARDVARSIIDRLGPSDLAAVVHPFKPGRTQDFTRDRTRLLASIDRFEPEQPEYLVLQPRLPGPVQGDIQRSSPALGRDPCFQLQPVIPTLRAVTAQLATVPQRRKALFFVSVGVPFVFRAGGTRCQGLLYDELRRTFDTAQRFNVNIHGIDPAGAAGYMRFLRQPRLRNARLVPGLSAARASEVAQVGHDFLETLGEQTGGRPIVNTDDLEGALTAVFREYSTYYLVAYETAPAFDGRFRTVRVSVNRPGADVRTRRGRWNPTARDVVNPTGPPAGVCVFDCWHVPPRPSEIQLTGLSPSEPLRLRAVATVVRAASATAGDTADIAATITVRLPPVLRSAEERLTLVRTIYDDHGRATPPVAETFVRRVDPGSGDETQYDVWSQFTLPPGRHEVRFNGTSRLADASGSVHLAVEVPPPARGPSASTIALGDPATDRRDPLANVLPVAPTTARDFARGQRVVAFLRFFADPAALRESLVVTSRIVGGDGTVLIEERSALAAAAFGSAGAADHRFELPLARLSSGLHLLSIAAGFDATSVIRRDVTFRVR